MNPMVLERLGGLHYSKNCEQSRPIGHEDIARLESEIGNPLPEEYAEFLLSHPLGPVRFGKNGVFCRNENGERLYLCTFYSIDQLTGLMPEEELVPRHLLSIIDNAIGDYVCIAVAGDRRGAVLSWLHELYDYHGGRPWLQPWELAVAEVAPSFGAFLESLEVDPNWGRR
jgi:hypothetical protein